MEYFATGSPDSALDAQAVEDCLRKFVDRLRPCRRVLLIPPDFTRYPSGSGEITAKLYAMLSGASPEGGANAGAAEVVVLPALGTHHAMTEEQRQTMFPGVPAEAFRVHDWRNDVRRLGEVPADRIRAWSGGRVDWSIDCAVNRLLVEERWDHIISVGQVLPHEVAGMAGHAKNVFVGVGGADTINKSHFLGAVCGMEQAMGRAATPVRAVLDHMASTCAAHLPIRYLLIVRGPDGDGASVLRGLYAGDDRCCFDRAAALAREANVRLLDEGIRKAVVYLPPEEYTSTWLGNKAIYRLRMALEDDGELLVIAPGVKSFGEDTEIDRLIRRYGYRGTPATLGAVAVHSELAANLAAAAHLIHGSSEGRFTITYAPGGLSREEIEGVGFAYADLEETQERYAASVLNVGWNDLPEGRIYFVENPGQGLWARRAVFENQPARDSE